MQMSVVIVSWNVREHLRRCLESIKAQTHDLDYEVIVVDNASADGSAEMVAKDFPWVKLIASNRNLGFGTANNRGAELTSGEVLFFLNDDTVLGENTLKLVYDKVIGDPTIGVLGTRLTNPDGSHQDSVRRYPRLADHLLLLLKLHNFFPNLGPVRRYFARDFDYSKEQEVDQVMGASMVMRRDVFLAAGGFDERFFVWYEEVDLQKRVHEQQKLRIVYSPLTEIVHVKGASFGQLMSFRSQRLYNRSMRQYFAKHRPWLETGIIAALQPASLLLAALVQLLKIRPKVKQ
jgi:hypothetical protein